MSVYTVSWDLNKEKLNYAQARAAFVAKLNELENKADSGLDSVRFVASTATADQVSAFLRTKLDNNDRLIVVKMSAGNHQGWLSQDVWDWINARL